jgi:competence protein ComEC
MCLALAIGFVAAQTRVDMVDTRMVQETGWATVTGLVRKVEARPGDHRITLSSIALTDTRIREAPSGIRVVVRGLEMVPATGARIRIKARIGPPSPPIAPGAFDFQRHAYFLGLGAVGFGAGDIEILAPNADDSPWWSGVDRVRSHVSTAVRKALGPDIGPIAAALLTGDRSGIPEPTLESLRRSGLAHLLAISGLHMALVVGTVLFGIRFGLAVIPGVALRWPTKKIAAGLALVAAAGYLLLAGAPVPTQRAFLMVGLVLIGQMLDRDALSLRMVALAAVVVLVPFPESLLGPSFQMSFAAVTALIAAYEGLRVWKARRMSREDVGIGLVPAPLRRFGGYFGGVALTSVIASAATAPIAAYHFQMVPLVGTIANLIAVPVTALVTMPAGVLALLLMPFGLEHIALLIMGYGIEATVWSAEEASAIPLAASGAPAAPAWAIAILALGALWMVIWRGPFRWAGLAGIGTAALAWGLVVPPSVVVSANADVVGVRFSDGAWAVSTDRRAGFVRDGWRTRWGKGDEIGFESIDSDSPGFGDLARQLTCDGMGCVYTINNRPVAILGTPESTAEDCPWASVVIVTVPVRTPCEGPDIVIDLNDIKALGAHSIWISSTGVRLETVYDHVGKRPWNAPEFLKPMRVVESH